jgi:chromatin segregation and condensation protein Rec8/ScpA/Scc1 (kleisin family)
VVASFLAILELVKANQIYIFQESSFEDIIISEPKEIGIDDE